MRDLVFLERFPFRAPVSSSTYVDSTPSLFSQLLYFAASSSWNWTGKYTSLSAQLDEPHEKSPGLSGFSARPLADKSELNLNKWQIQCAHLLFFPPCSLAHSFWSHRFHHEGNHVDPVWLQSPSEDLYLFPEKTRTLPDYRTFYCK